MTNAIQRNADLLEQFSPGITDHAEHTYRAMFPDLVDHTVDSIYGFAYRRTAIDLKSRHLMTLAILCTLGGCEGQLDFQLKAALQLGLSPDEIREVFIQVAVLAGNARATNAARQFQTLLEQRAGLPSSAPRHAAVQNRQASSA
ncbi:hypothetical protein CDN99_17865 [Roseateles aquatilis]|uniref:Carboxymuconolactone decarboxylase-like domain-containing protein n=1 Tax=Roseateles aquatilis TaxID=431061 RepID=A0A246J4E1_9BURK|nr:carboxymuconolactone decarboxylase family protein [Roseateles aquatilis]OWQ87471.1 hypothetical protein CDN99_17865 [Roseateles aquatilis]